MFGCAKKKVASAEKTSGSDWPQWRGPQRDNVSTETGLSKQWPADGPAMLWSAEGIGMGFSSVAVAGEKIYTTGMIENQGMLTCFDLNGQQLWQSNYGPEWKRSFPGARCTPTIDDGHAYIISGTGQVACLNAETGEKRWLVDAFGQFQGHYPKWGYAECPIVSDDKVFFVVGGEKALAVALDKKDGTVVWTTPANGDKNAFCSPLSVQFPGLQFLVTMTSDNIIGINQYTGELIFSYPCSNYITGRNQNVHPNTPIYHKGKILISSGYDMGSIQLKLSDDTSSVEKVWTNLEFDNHHGGIVLIDGYLYGANWLSNRQGNWMCVDWNTGETVYEHEWGNKGSFTYADGMFYCYEEVSGTIGLVKASPSDFEVVSQFTVPLGEKEHWAHPVVSDKRLYIRHGDVLMVFDITE